MFQKFLYVITLCLMFILAFSTGTSAREEMSRTEQQSISAEGVEKILFRDIDFTDLTYAGEENRDSFSVIIKYTIKTDDENEFEELLSDFDLDISTSDETVTMRLIHPKYRNYGFFKRLFRHKEWRVTMDVTGPKAVDMDIDAGFSEIKTDDTSGGMEIDADFSDTICRNHKGMLKTNISFGNFDAVNLNGSFNINSDFSNVDLRLEYFADDSRASTNFGDIDIWLPANTGAEFHVNKSFAGINFNTTGTLSYEGEKGKLRILNDGGPIIDLTADFGSIAVKDNLPEYTGTVSISDADDEQDKEMEDTPSPKPVFKEGTIISITVRGTRLLAKEDVEQMLNIRKGEHYKLDDISTAVKLLKDNSRLINWASFTIDIDGNLSVRVYEVEPFTKDFDIYGSFSRVAGVGFGPRLTFNSVIGPLSELSGGTQYHWGNKEWTYNVRAEKSLFEKNRLVFGGTYRQDYESSMNWAIPAHDSYLNAFLLGIETINYYQVEGATGYISQSFSDIFTVRAEYFEEDYSSLKKHTNWSLFNHRHKKEDNPSLAKEDNPPLAFKSEGRLTGLRYSVQLRKNAFVTNTMLYLEAESTFDTRSDTLPAYTRFLGNFIYNMYFPYRHLLKLRLTGGYSDDALPDQKSFRLGGVNTLRGFAFGEIPEPPSGTNGFNYQGGGNRMLLANIDYFTGRSGDDLRFIFFGDIGGVWQKREDVDMKDLKRDLGIGIAFGGDFFTPDKSDNNAFNDSFRINWAIPVGNVPHVSQWTVNFVRAY